MDKYEYIKWYVKDFHGEYAPLLFYEVDKDNETYESTTNEEGNGNSIGMRSAKDENEIFFPL